MGVSSKALSKIGPCSTREEICAPCEIIQGLVSYLALVQKIQLECVVAGRVLVAGVVFLTKG